MEPTEEDVVDMSAVNMAMTKVMDYLSTLPEQWCRSTDLDKAMAVGCTSMSTLSRAKKMLKNSGLIFNTKTKTVWVVGMLTGDRDRDMSIMHNALQSCGGADPLLGDMRDLPAPPAIPTCSTTTSEIREADALEAAAMAAKASKAAEYERLKEVAKELQGHDVGDNAAHDEAIKRSIQQEAGSPSKRAAALRATGVDGSLAELEATVGESQDLYTKQRQDYDARLELAMLEIKRRVDQMTTTRIIPLNSTYSYEPLGNFHSSGGNIFDTSSNLAAPNTGTGRQDSRTKLVFDKPSSPLAPAPASRPAPPPTDAAIARRKFVRYLFEDEAEEDTSEAQVDGADELLLEDNDDDAPAADTTNSKRGQEDEILNTDGEGADLLQRYEAELTAKLERVHQMRRLAAKNKSPHKASPTSSPPLQLTPTKRRLVRNDNNMGYPDKITASPLARRRLQVVESDDEMQDLADPEPDLQPELSKPEVEKVDKVTRPAPLQPEKEAIPERSTLMRIISDTLAVDRQEPSSPPDVPDAHKLSEMLRMCPSPAPLVVLDHRSGQKVTIRGQEVERSKMVAGESSDVSNPDNAHLKSLTPSQVHSTEL